MYGSNDFSSLVARADDRYKSTFDPGHYNPYYDPGYENTFFTGDSRLNKRDRLTQEIDLNERGAQDFLESVLLSFPEVAAVYGPLTLEEANSNLQVSPYERRLFKEGLKNMPELQQRLLDLRKKYSGV